jgi:hypothetical protein
MEESGKPVKPEADSLLDPDSQHVPELEDVLSQAPAPTEIAIDDVRPPLAKEKKFSSKISCLLLLLAFRSMLELAANPCLDRHRNTGIILIMLPMRALQSTIN